MSEMHCDKAQGHYIGAAVREGSRGSSGELGRSVRGQDATEKRPRNQRVAASTFFAICC